jgi:hypothetical protein
MGAPSLSQSATETLSDISVAITFLFGTVFLIAWIVEVNAKSEKWKGRATVLMVLTIVGAAGEMFGTLGEFVLSKHLQTISDARIVKLTASRTLTDAQIGVVIRKLKVFAGQEFNITPYWTNKESLDLCKRIDTALVGAGWKYTPPANGTMLMGGVVGVLVVADSQSDAKVLNAARLLVSSLNEEGISAELTTQHIDPKPSNKLDVEVGTKS